MSNRTARAKALKDLPFIESPDDLPANFGGGFTDPYADLLAKCARLEAALGLKECAFCGTTSFEISPFKPSVGFCWNEEKLFKIDPARMEDDDCN